VTEVSAIRRLVPVAAAGLTLAAGAIAFTATASDRPTQERTAKAGSPAAGGETVLEVQSGDMFSSATGSAPRLTRIIGIDAPDPGQCGFERAKRHLSSLIEDRRVVLPRDHLQPARDKAGRRLRYVVVGNAASARDVGYWSVASGWARVSLEHDFVLVAEYLEAQARGQQEARGVWRCGRDRR
jgi:endonuclease YncB( thermonuclease family)